MRLTMLGTGNAVVTECYNTCFVLEDKKEYVLVDGGGGNTLLRQLKHAHMEWKNIKHIFVTHKHVDHAMGILWMMRMILQNMKRGKYEGEANIYAHKELIEIMKRMADLLFPEMTQFIGQRLHLIAVEDGQELTLIGHKTTFFDIQSTKAKQFGFTMEISDGERLTCCGDEPCHDCEIKYAKGSKWLMHEAFCLYREAAIFKPYEKHHSTVKDACEFAEKMDIRNLILYHTEDRNIKKRKALYTAEGRKYYHGNLFVPDDLEVIDL